MTPPNDKPRDWDKELAEVDRLIAAGEPSAARAPVLLPGSPPPVAQPAGSTRDRVFTWIRLTLGISLGVAITQWPYVHGCGFALFAYLGAVTTVSVAGAWTAISSWRSRSAWAHSVSIGLLFWGLALAAREVLPRIGYAKEAATWLC